MHKLLTVSLLAGLIFFPGCGSDKSTQAPVPPDDAPPLMPTGLASQYVDGGYAVLTWAPNTEPDLAGYRVYVFDPSPQRDGAYVLQNTDALLSETEWSCPVQYGQTFWARVTAVDSKGNESGASGPMALVWQAPVGQLPDTKPPTPGASDSNAGDVRGPGMGTPQDPNGPKEDGTADGGGVSQ